MVHPPRYLRLAYPGAVWNIPTQEKVLYLTFDDGPVPEVTLKVLELLKSYEAKATFFCIGDNVRKHPDVYARVLQDGHTVGNHTFHHYNAWKTDRRTFLNDTQAAAQIIDSKLFRPPYGKLTPLTLMGIRKNYRIIMWDVISCDFDINVPKEQVWTNVRDHAKPGSIVVFHDSLKASVNMFHALEKTLEHFAQDGFSFQSLEPFS